MKKTLSIAILVIFGSLIFTSTMSAQNQHILSLKLQLKLHKYLDYSEDGHFGYDDAAKHRKRIKIEENNCECNGFVDEDGDGLCDNCGGVGILDRTRLTDGKGKKRRGDR